MKKYEYIFNRYKNLFYDRYGVKPEINYAQCSKLLMERIENRTEEEIVRIIELYFENEKSENVFHLPTILSAYIFNKYLPQLNQKLNPNMYTNEN